MADKLGQDSLKQRYNERRDRLRLIVANINNILDYFERVPATESEEQEQKQGMRSDLYKLENRIADFRSELE